MDKVIMPDILTLEETSKYLRLPVETVLNEVVTGNIPGRKIEGNWRFLKIAIDDWLRAKNSRFVLLNQAGAFADDNSLEAIKDDIYRARGRSEIDDNLFDA
jgi:hypothetical protein